MTAAAKSFLLPEEDPELRRWFISAGIVIALHAALVSWIMHRRDISLAGAPPAVLMFELAPIDVAPPSDTPPDVTPGPQMTQAQPEEKEEPQTVQVPELPIAQKPTVVLMAPRKPKPKPKKPKKIISEIPKPVKPERRPPAPRTSAPPRAEAEAARAAGSPAFRAGQQAAALNACRSAVSYGAKNYPEGAAARGEQGWVPFVLTFGRNGHVTSARLVGSSGFPALDQAALEIVRHATCPAMEPSARFTVNVHFHLR